MIFAFSVPTMENVTRRTYAGTEHAALSIVDMPNTLRFSFRDPMTVDALEPTPPPPRADPEARAERPSIVEVIGIIQDAAHEFGIADYARFQGTAYCESRYDPLAIGKDRTQAWSDGGQGERGLWQFMFRTWMGNAPALGYSEADVFDARASSRVAAYMMAKLNQSYQWTCWRDSGPT